MMVRVAQLQIKQAAASVAAQIRRNFIPKLNSCRTAKLRLNVVSQKGAMTELTRRLTESEPDNPQWPVSLAYATRRGNSIEAAKEILLNAKSKILG
jgi:hypothetical protein